MKIERFEDIIAWQKSKGMCLLLYSLFKDLKDFGFKDQICRASVSIMNNIAEGFERKTNSEFTHFLFMAKGSCGEVRSMVHLAKELKYLDPESYDNLIKAANEISKMISGLIKTLK